MCGGWQAEDVNHAAEEALQDMLARISGATDMEANAGLEGALGEYESILNDVEKYADLQVA